MLVSQFCECILYLLEESTGIPTGAFSSDQNVTGREKILVSFVSEANGALPMG